jgi:predicted ferric reductase
MIATAALESVGDGLWSLTMAPDGHAGLSYGAGQFAWPQPDCSAFSVREHPFSIASAPSDWKALRFLIKEVGDFTRQIGALPTGARALSGRQAGARHFRDCRRRRAGAHAFLVAGRRRAR